MVQCGTVWCGVMCDQCHRVGQCGTVWCGVVMCDQCHRVVQRYGIVWAVECCGAVWYGMVWCRDV